MNEKKSRVLLAITYLIFLMGGIFDIIPITIALPIAAIITTIFTVLYLKNNQFPVGYFGCSIALGIFLILSIIYSFDTIFPYIGTCFYLSFAIVYIVYSIKGVINPLPLKLFYGAIAFLYALSAVVSYLLFANPTYMYLPALISVVPSVIGGRILKKKYKNIIKLKMNGEVLPLVSRKTWSVVAMGALIVVSINAISYIKKQTIEIPKDAMLKLNHLKEEVSVNPNGKTFLEIGTILFEYDKFEESKEWFEKSTKYDDVSHIAWCYLGTLMGIEAEKGGTPFDRVNLVKRSVNMIDSLVDYHNDNKEIRYIRASYYSQLPINFKKRKIAISDLKELIENSPKDTEYHKLAMATLKEVDKEEWEAIQE